MPDYSPIEIAKPGRAVAVNGAAVEFTPELLADLADSYDPTLFEAPIVVGHPTLNAPAWGSIGQVRFDAATQRVAAVPSHVDPAFAEAVQRRLYRSVSLSMYLPDAPSNPKPGRHYLRHVGFLGAHPPAIKGLRGVEFGADETGVVAFGEQDDRTVAGLFRSLKNWLIGSAGQETAEQALPEWDLKMLAESAVRESLEESITETPVGFAAPANPGATMTQPPTETPAEFAEREQALNQKETELAAREAALREQEQAAERRACLAFAERLVAAGRLLPRDQAGIAEFMATLSTADSLEFGEGDSHEQLSPRAWFERWANTLPVQVDFGEWDRGAAPEDAPSFAAPADGTVDTARLGLHAKAVAYQQQHQCPYRDAVAAVSAAH